MKYYQIAALVAATTTAIAFPALAADVGVSVSIGQPGFYGRLDIGGYPQPQVLYRQPVVIQQVPMSRPPIYLRVPPGHAKNWSKYCRHYNACGERVYFVQDNWYNREYVPQYKNQHRGHDDDRDNGYRNDNRRNHGNDDHGKDKGNKHGNDRGHGRDD